jgi:dienelactone hydrolase
MRAGTLRSDDISISTRFRRACLGVGLGVALAAAFASSGGAAKAQMTLVSAQSGAAAQGPAGAKGAVVWSHGRSIEVEDSQAPTPAYIEALREAGWDTLRFDRMRASDRLPASGATLARVADELKRAGYRRVVLAGQSFGAFISLIAAAQSDAVDAVIATAPAAFGNAQDNPDTYGLNATRLYELLGEVRRARVALFFFDGDVFDPGGRGPAANRILAERGLSSLVVDRPSAFPTHWAASTPAFAARFGGCLGAFAETDAVHGTLDCRVLSGGLRVAGMP